MSDSPMRRQYIDYLCKRYSCDPKSLLKNHDDLLTGPLRKQVFFMIREMKRGES